jgi:hypothetical protein
MSKVFHVPTLFLSVSFISALLSIGHGTMVVPREHQVLVTFLPPVMLGVIYSLLLNRMAKSGVARFVFRSSLLTVVGFVLMFLWMISLYYFPNLYPNDGYSGNDFTFIIYLGVAFFAVPVITLYSIFALWLPTKLATEASSGGGDGRVIASIHGGFWGLSLFLLCFAIYFPTYAMFSGSYEQVLRGVKNLASIELGICVATFIGSMGSWFLTAKIRLP